MLGRLSALLLQLALVAVAVPVANELNEARTIVPWRFHKATPLDMNALAVIAGLMLLFHFVVLAGMLLFNRTHPFATFRRFFAEGYAAMIATSLGAMAVFLLTTVPFLPNLFAWLFLVVFVGYFLIFFGFRLFGPADLREGAAEKSFLSLVFSPWTVLAAAIIAAPGVLAFAYKASQPFSNAVNDLKARLSTTVDSRYGLVDAFPGQVFDQPMMFVFEPGEEEILVLSRTGILRRHATAGEAEAEVVLDLSEEVGSTDAELGAYSIALHPEYGRAGSPNAGHVFFCYTAASEAGQFSRLARYDISPATAEERAASRTLLWDLGRPATGTHNGCGMFFGPDGFLYVSLGDFNQHEGTQQIDQRLTGGIFRIDPDMRGGEISTPIRKTPDDATTANYYIPTDNPWYGEEGVLEEYWALGFRNPWRMIFDQQTGAIWLGDVGRSAFEEHDRVVAGDNAQWPFREGPEETELPRPETPIGREIEPVYWYAQTALARAAMGGPVYRAGRFPELAGQYIFADNMAATISALDPDDPMGTARIIARGGQYGQLGMTSIAVDSAGEIYFTFLGQKDEPTGEIARLTISTDAEAGAEGDEVAGLGQEIDTLFESVCGRCHGSDGRGEQDIDLGKPRPDFTSLEWQQSVSDEHLRLVIEEGGEAVGMSPIMPGWSEVLSAEEIDLMVQKVRSFGG